MTPRPAVLVALVALAAISAPAAAAATSATVAAPADDTYVAQATTSCGIAAPEVVKRGAALAATVRVRANSAAQPRGTITFTVSRTPGGQVYTRTLDYLGGAVEVTGPRLDRAGDYRAEVSFEPVDRSVFRRCGGSAAFEVSQGLAPDNRDEDGDNDNDNNGGGGVLPDTGGPDFWLLLLGMGLVGSGGTLVVVARRRRPEPSFG